MRSPKSVHGWMGQIFAEVLSRRTEAHPSDVAWVDELILVENWAEELREQAWSPKPPPGTGTC